MIEKNMYWQHPVVFFITRMFILAGMMLVFAGFAYSIAIFTSKALFGVDFMANPALLGDFKNPENINALKYIQALTSAGIFIYPAWYFCKALNKKPADFLKINRKITFSEIGISTLLVFVIMPFGSWLVYVNGLIKFPPSMAQLEIQLKAAEELAAQLTQLFIKADTISDLTINLLVIAVIPAIGEEFLFRGVLQNFVKTTTGKGHFSVWIIAIVFSAFHGQFYGFLPRVFLGAALGYAFLFTGNLWVSILMHFVNNAFAVICSYTPIKNSLPPVMQDGYVFESWVINAGSALLAIGLLLLLHKVTFKRVWYNGE
ncbi:MAG: CPBP family intramembrane metalloprotease [Bacteroidia bacterium]|nr:CPBP family intramembrane metalloprotease [Bacteroidia bacterium]MBP9688301.1 CPBP family intramembrane metalloprotease [Bacteroidia bacterium]